MRSTEAFSSSVARRANRQEFLKLGVNLKSIFYFLLFLICVYSDRLEDLKKLKSSDRYEFFLIESFEDGHVWEVLKKHTYLSSLSLTKKIPFGNLFEIEKSLFESVETEFPKSLQVHGHIEIPGRDKIIFANTEKKFFPHGRPVMLSIWVHSSNYPIHLKATLGQKNSKDLNIDFGELNFQGWKRLEAKVNFVREPNRLNYSKREEFNLKNLFLESLPNMPKNDFVVHLDNISVIIEKYKEYPGSEIPDGWYLE